MKTSTSQARLTAAMFKLTICLLGFATGMPMHPAVAAEKAQASLQGAFQQEYAFLTAQKRALMEQITATKAAQAKEIANAQAEIAALEQRHATVVARIESETERLENVQTAGDDAGESTELIASTLVQTQEALAKFKHVTDNGAAIAGDFLAGGKNAKEAVPGGPAPEESAASGDLTGMTERLIAATDASIKILGKVSGVRSEKTSFFLRDGTKAEGDVTFVGNIAAFGTGSSYRGALAPAGGGELKALQADTAASADKIAQGPEEGVYKLYLFESPYAEAVEQQEKTWIQTIDSGGRVSWLIFFLGVLAAVMTLVRYIVLQRSAAKSKRLTREVGQLIANDQLEKAAAVCKSSPGVIAKVLSNTLANIHRPRMFIEDIVNETIIHESRLIDKFGSFIIITSTVAPLLGLLGTVAGMIATFNMLTEFGTGNPKLLSGGISEALVCTMMGLVVAIPALLLGNLMNGWAEKIKEDMAHAALHITNLFQNKLARQKGSQA